MFKEYSELIFISYYLYHLKIAIIGIFRFFGREDSEGTKGMPVTSVLMGQTFESHSTAVTFSAYIQSFWAAI
jgi:hypothetical protein